MNFYLAVVVAQDVVSVVQNSEIRKPKSVREGLWFFVWMVYVCDRNLCGVFVVHVDVLMGNGLA